MRNKALIFGSAFTVFMFCMPISSFITGEIDDWQQVKRDKKIIAEHKLASEPNLCHTKYGDYSIALDGKRPYLWSDSSNAPIPIRIEDYDFDDGKIVHYYGVVKSPESENDFIPERTVLIDAMYKSKTCTITFFDNTCSGSSCMHSQDGVLM